MSVPQAHAVWKEREGGTGPSTLVATHSWVLVENRYRSALAPSLMSLPVCVKGWLEHKFFYITIREGVAVGAIAIA